MATPLQDRLEAALANFRTQQDKIRAFQAEMKTKTTTVLSKNRMVEATVDATGVLTSLVFKGNRYRTLPPAELSALVVETVSTAQKQAKDAAMSAAVEMTGARGLLGSTSLFGDGAGGPRDLESIFDSALGAAGTPILEEPAAETGRSGKEKQS